MLERIKDAFKPTRRKIGFSLIFPVIYLSILCILAYYGSLASQYYCEYGEKYAIPALREQYLNNDSVAAEKIRKESESFFAKTRERLEPIDTSLGPIYDFYLRISPIPISFLGFFNGKDLECIEKNGEIAKTLVKNPIRREDGGAVVELKPSPIYLYVINLIYFFVLNYIVVCLFYFGFSFRKKN